MIELSFIFFFKEDWITLTMFVFNKSSISYLEFVIYCLSKKIQYFTSSMLDEFRIELRINETSFYIINKMRYYNRVYFDF